MLKGYQKIFQLIELNRNLWTIKRCRGVNSTNSPNLNIGQVRLRARDEWDDSLSFRIHIKISVELIKHHKIHTDRKFSIILSERKQGGQGRNKSKHDALTIKNLATNKME